jgi:hypothetical protein
MWPAAYPMHIPGAHLVQIRTALLAITHSALAVQMTNDREGCHPAIEALFRTAASGDVMSDDDLNWLSRQRREAKQAAAHSAANEERARERERVERKRTERESRLATFRSNYTCAMDGRQTTGPIFHTVGNGWEDRNDPEVTFVTWWPKIWSSASIAPASFTRTIDVELPMRRPPARTARAESEQGKRCAPSEAGA